MKVLQIGKKQLLLLCLGLVLVVAVAIVEPGVLLGLAVGFGAGAFCYKRYPEKFRFRKENPDKARIRELEEKIQQLEMEAA